MHALIYRLTVLRNGNTYGNLIQNLTFSSGGTTSLFNDNDSIRSESRRIGSLRRIDDCLLVGMEALNALYFRSRMEQSAAGTAFEISIA